MGRRLEAAADQQCCEGSPEEGKQPSALLDVEDQLGLGLPYDPVNGHVVEDEVAQRFGVRHGDVDVEVVLPCHMEDLQDPWCFGELPVELVDVRGVMAAEANLDHGLQGIAQGLEANSQSPPHDDAGIAEGADAVGTRRLCDTESGSQGFVGEVGVVEQGGQDLLIEGVQLDPTEL